MKYYKPIKYLNMLQGLNSKIILYVYIVYNLERTTKLSHVVHYRFNGKREREKKKLNALNKAKKAV